MNVKTITKVLVTNDAGEILCLVRSKDDDIRAGGWDFPGGKVDPGEDLNAAAIRETAEEAGITISSPRLVYATTDEQTWGVAMFLVFTEKVTGRPAVRLSHEHEAYEWLTPEALLAKEDYPLHRELFRFTAKYNLL